MFKFEQLTHQPPTLILHLHIAKNWICVFFLWFLSRSLHISRNGSDPLIIEIYREFVRCFTINVDFKLGQLSAFSVVHLVPLHFRSSPIQILPFNTISDKNPCSLAFWKSFSSFVLYCLCGWVNVCGVFVRLVVWWICRKCGVSATAFSVHW